MGRTGISVLWMLWPGVLFHQMYFKKLLEKITNTRRETSITDAHMATSVTSSYIQPIHNLGDFEANPRYDAR